jgi:hypothetical protein
MTPQRRKRPFAAAAGKGSDRPEAVTRRTVQLRRLIAP